MRHDLTLHSGERQTASVYADIRPDHRFRYEWAAARLPGGTFGLDAFCGNGYGTWLLSESRVVWGIDGSAEAIAAANTHYVRPSAFYSAAYYPFQLPAETFDFVVALESVEHVEDGAAFFEVMVRALKPGGHLIFSTPCEEMLPHHATGNHFHFKHYTLAETLALAGSCGLRMESFAGQNTYRFTEDGRQGPLLEWEQMQLQQGQPGQFLIVHARKLGSGAAA